MMEKSWVNIGSRHWSFSEEGGRYSEQIDLDGVF